MGRARERLATPAAKLLIPVALGCAAMAACSSATSWDGSYYLVRLADDGSPFTLPGRRAAALLQLPALLVRHLTGSLPATRVAFSIAYATVPLLSLFLCHLVCRKAAPDMLIWPALAVTIGLMPGQWFGVSEILIAAELAWPIWLAVLLGLPRGSRTIAFLCAVAIYELHPGSSVLFLLTAVVAAARWRFAQQPNMARLAAAVTVVAIVRFAQVRSGYESDTLSWRFILHSGLGSVFGPQGVAFALALLAGLLLIQPVRSLRAARPAQPLLVLAFALLTFWVVWPRLWTHVLAFRAVAAFAGVPFLALAAYDLFSAREHRVSPLLRARMVVVCGVGFAVVMAVQSLAWTGLTRHLRHDLGAGPVCRSPGELAWTRHTPLDLWPTADLAIVVQGRNPSRLLLDGSGCAERHIVGARLHPTDPPVPLDGWIGLP